MEVHLSLRVVTKDEEAITIYRPGRCTYPEKKSVLTSGANSVHPKGDGTAGGRPPVPLERLLLSYFLQLRFYLSDPAVEEAMYDSAAMH